MGARWKHICDRCRGEYSTLGWKMNTGHWSRYLMGIALTALLLVTACAPSSETEGLTYTNSEYGYSVEYPEGWDVLEESEGALVLFTGPLIEKAGGSARGKVVSENLTQSPEVTHEEYVRQNKLTMGQMFSSLEVVDEYDAVVSGITATVLTYTFEWQGITIKATNVVFIKDNIGYVIGYDAMLEYYDDYLGCLQLMMSTFKFE
jgi:hypothetical protein